MTKRILIMGLPGAGKTTLAEEVCRQLLDQYKTVAWFNADQVRKIFDDWDFSESGRIRQSWRMRELADDCGADYAICDFVAPLSAMRDNFAAHYTVWVDTIVEGRFDDTNKVFTIPSNYDIRVTSQNADDWALIVTQKITQN